MRPNIRALAIDFSWVVSVPEYGKEFVVVGLVRIKPNLDRLGIVHITRHDRGHARRLFKNFLRAPETTPREIGYV